MGQFTIQDYCENCGNYDLVNDDGNCQACAMYDDDGMFMGF